MCKLVLVIILWGIFAWPATAAEPLQIQQYQGIPYVSGGVGDEEQQALEAMKARFNLKLVFAGSSGEYLADIAVRIQDQQGNTVFQANANGPWFYVSLPAGTYTVQASGFGKSLERKIELSSGKLREVIFRW